MKAEKYVKDVIKKVKCGRKQKKNISQQLLSEITSEVEAGETLENVLKRMGPAQDTAAEFNENLSEEDVKKYKREKRTKIIILILIIIGLLFSTVYCLLPKTSSIEESNTFNADAVKQQMVTVVELLAEEDYAKLRELSVDSMKNTMTKEVIDSAKKGIGDNWGTLKTVDVRYTAEIKQLGKTYVVSEVNAMYENVSVTYTISLDKDMRIAGLYMK